MLNRDASLRAGFGTVRIVKDGLQVPYFSGPSEEQVIDLAAAPEYDKKKNRTFWTVELPDRSADLRELTAESAGIFDRTVQFELPLQGRAGWQVWRTMRWQNASQTSSVLRLSLAGLPLDAKKLRITMEHGDNRPIELRKLQASYAAPALLFLASAAGEYALYGGNEKVSAGEVRPDPGAGAPGRCPAEDRGDGERRIGKLRWVQERFRGSVRGQELGALRGARRGDPDPDDRDRQALP